MANAETNHATGMADIDATIIELRAQQARATKAFQLQQAANDELLAALLSKQDAITPGQKKAEALHASEQESQLGQVLNERITPHWCAQNGLAAMPPEGLKALLAQFLDAVQSVQAAKQDSTMQPAISSTVDGSMNLDLQEGSMSESNAGRRVCRKSMWSEGSAAIQAAP